MTTEFETNNGTQPTLGRPESSAIDEVSIAVQSQPNQIMTDEPFWRDEGNIVVFPQSN